MQNNKINSDINEGNIFDASNTFARLNKLNTERGIDSQDMKMK